jgi:Domain of unknown function (DUF5753)
MRSQLYRLAEVAEHTRPRTTIQIIRADGAHVGLLEHFVSADLDGKPPVVYLETAAEGIVTDSSSAAAHVALSFDGLRADAELRAVSLDLIRKVPRNDGPDRQSVAQEQLERQQRRNLHRGRHHRPSQSRPRQQAPKWSPAILRS